MDITTPLTEDNAPRLWQQWAGTHAPQWAHVPVFYQASTSSSNTMALHALGQGLQQAINIAGLQTAGQGQRGSTWVSPAGNIYVSILWPSQQALSGQLSLELALQLVALPWLHQPQPLAIKWPNDLVDAAGRKVGGILVLPHGDHVIVGVGLNTAVAPILHSTKYLSNSLADIYNLPSHPSMVFSLCAAIIAVLRQQTYAADLPARFAPYHYLLGKHCTLQHNQQAISGICQGVQANGALQLLTPSGTQLCYTGPIVINPP